MAASEHRRRVRCERCGVTHWDDDDCWCADLDDDELDAELTRRRDAENGAAVSRWEDIT